MKQVREHWGSRIGFILATAGSAIGLGSLWRFPYVTGQNGGGLFVLLYLVFTFFIALPVFIGELVIGRSSQLSAVGAFSKLSNESPNWKLLGWLTVLTTFLILSYYCVVSGWCVNYIFLSLTKFTEGKTPEQIRSVFDTLQASGDINLFWTFIFLLFNIGVVCGGVRKGIEHWSRLLTPALMCILISLFIFSITLDGFGQAFRFVFYPDCSTFSASSVLHALGMSFFTLSVGLGIILTYGSYMLPSENIAKTGLIVSGMTVLVSLMSAMMIFPIIFTFGIEPQVGAGLVFKTLPILFAKLPGSLVISTIFFVLLVFTSLTSSISLFEVLVANLMELFNWQRIKAVIISSSAVFLFAMPSALSGSGCLFANWKSMYGRTFFETLDYVTGNWMLLLSALFTTLFIGWIMRRQTVYEEFLKGSKFDKIVSIWFFMIRWLAPLAILLIVLEEAKLIDINLFSNYCRIPSK